MSRSKPSASRPRVARASRPNTRDGRGVRTPLPVFSFQGCRGPAGLGYGLVAGWRASAKRARPWPLCLAGSPRLGRSTPWILPAIWTNWFSDASGGTGSTRMIRWAGPPVDRRLGRARSSRRGGLIVNEHVTNSLLYAFPLRSQGVANCLGGHFGRRVEASQFRSTAMRLRHSAVGRTKH
jgi:hypothetical protein